MARFNLVRRFLNLPAATLVCRVILGLLFVVTGGLKALTAPEEMVAIFRAYQIIPAFLLWPTVHILPWLELISGAFCLLGYFTRSSATVIGLQLAAFILVLGAVLALGVKLEDCGCFGGLGLREGPGTAIIRDLILLGMASLVVRRPYHRLSLDAWMAGSQAA